MRRSENGDEDESNVEDEDCNSVCDDSRNDDEDGVDFVEEERDAKSDSDDGTAVNGSEFCGKPDTIA